MSEEQREPGELTERFQAFANSTDPAPSRALPFALIALAAALVVVLVAVILVLTR